MNINNKNPRTREQILVVCSNICEVYGTEVFRLINDLHIRMGALLSDPLPSVRQIALESIVKLILKFGDQILVIRYFTS